MLVHPVMAGPPLVSLAGQRRVVRTGGTPMVCLIARSVSFRLCPFGTLSPTNQMTMAPAKTIFLYKFYKQGIVHFHVCWREVSLEDLGIHRSIAKRRIGFPPCLAQVCGVCGGSRTLHLECSSSNKKTST